MKRHYGVIASLEGYQGEQLIIHRIKGNKVYMTVKTEENSVTDWYTLSYKRVGNFNQSVKKVRLPYIVHENDVYSIDDFHEWKR